MNRSVLLAALLLICALILVIIAVTGGAHATIDFVVAGLLAAAGIGTLIRVRRDG